MIIAVRRLGIVSVVLAAVAIAMICGWFAVSSSTAAIDGSGVTAAVPPGSSGVSATTATPPAAPRPAPLKKLKSISGIFTAAGVRQYLDCRGPTEKKAVPGEPPLMVIPGLHSGADYLSGLTEGLRRSHYVCVYDRPGIEESPSRSGRLSLTAQDHARELAALLRKAGVDRKV
ncbi:MAG: hypothetical protein WCI74_15835, partial [Actinomycetes bacterium]